MPHFIRLTMTTAIAVAILIVAAAPQLSFATMTDQPALTFSCRADNDLFSALSAAGAKVQRYDSPKTAVEKSKEGGTVLFLADKYPAASTKIGADVWDAAKKKGLQIYAEYPKDLPGRETTGSIKAVWERGVIASDDFGSSLPKHRILAIHDCHFLSLESDNPLMVIARVAGYDTAIYGLPQRHFPILFELPEENIMVATTKLSGYMTGRYAPTADWQLVWKAILAKLAPDVSLPDFSQQAHVHPAYQRDAKLPADHEAQAFRAAAKWYTDSGLLISESRKNEIYTLLRAGAGTTTLSVENDPTADGSHGILEGYSANICWDGSQLQFPVIRADCNAETAMALALDASVNSNRRSRAISSNLFDFVYSREGMYCMDRDNPKHPAFGLIAWGIVAPAWEIANYAEDNARVMMSTMLAGSVMKSDRWKEPLLKALLANLRTTSRKGFKGDRIDMADIEKNGWKHYHESETINDSPHFEAYTMACYLWAYRETGIEEFLEKGESGISTLMSKYPDRWRLKDNTERSRMILPLAWLVRLDDTAEHRAWLSRVADDMLARQQPFGGIQEWLGGTGGGHYQIPQTNEAYGTGETPLIQKNGDPVTDQLYANCFAFFGLREAFAATGDDKYRKAEDKLAEYLCRIQTRSRKHPWINGTWFRAFDFQRWDYWASSADAGWGAWSSEAGWSHAWITATFGLRLRGETFWDSTANSGLKKHLPAVQKLMAENTGEPWKK